MIGLDTNVLVRFLAQADEAQAAAVLTMLTKRNATFFVPDLVLVETAWVLTSLYDWTNDEVASAYGRLLAVHNLAFENEGRLRGALRALRQGADLSDELIVDTCRAVGCKQLATFDRGLQRRHPAYAVVPGR